MSNKKSNLNNRTSEGKAIEAKNIDARKEAKKNLRPVKDDPKAATSTDDFAKNSKRNLVESGDANARKNAQADKIRAQAKAERLKAEKEAEDEAKAQAEKSDGAKVKEDTPPAKKITPPTKK